MSDESEDRDALQELELLLPFHTTGRLTPSEATRAERYFSDHPDRWQLLSEEKDAVVAGNEAISARRVHSFARVAAAISATRDQPVMSRGVFGAIRWFFDRPSAQSVRWVGAAAAVLIAIQTAAIGTLLVAQSSNQYATASGGSVLREPGRLVTIRFADGATAPAIATLLAGLDMRIVDGPVGGGLFTIRIGPQGMSDAERDRAIASLKARRDLVAFVTRLQ